MCAGGTVIYVLWAALLLMGVVGFALLWLGERRDEQPEGRHRLSQLTSALTEDTMILPITREDERMRDMSRDSDEMKGWTQHDHEHDQAHAEHAVACPVCSEYETIRTHMSKRYLATDDARKALKDGIEAALSAARRDDSWTAIVVLERALAAHGAALLTNV